MWMADCLVATSKNKTKSLLDPEKYHEMIFLLDRYYLFVLISSHGAKIDYSQTYLIIANDVAI